MNLKTLSLQRQFSLISLLFLGSLLLVFLLMAILFILPDYQTLENDYLGRRLRQLSSLLESEVDHLDLFSRDWSYWNDTYDFVQTGDPAYIESNLGPETLLIANLDFFAFYNIEGTLVYAELRPELARSSAINSGDVLDTFSLDPDAPPTRDWVVRGFMNKESESFALFTFRPVFRTDRSGPARGYILVGRGVDDAFLKGISKSLQAEVSLTITPAEGSILINQEDSPAHYILKSGFFNTGSWQATLPINQFNGKSGFLITFLHEPEIYLQGIHTVVLTSTIFVTVFLLLMSSYYALILRLMLRPIIKLTRFVERKSDSLIAPGIKDRKASRNEVHILAKRFYRLLSEFQERYRHMEIEAGTDALTGVENRRSIMTRLEKTCRQGGRDGYINTLGVIMVDVDHFKEVNDIHGHPAGDAVLKKLGPLLSSCLRENDHLGRYGGEEFMILMTNQGKDTVSAVAERLRLRVEKETWPLPSKKLTISCGWHLSSCPCDPVEILSVVDTNLYKAKSNGRNRIEGP
jgi:diguanylate cyclase (GGDEF)-like protein